MRISSLALSGRQNAALYGRRGRPPPPPKTVLGIYAKKGRCSSQRPREKFTTAYFLRRIIRLIATNPPNPNKAAVAGSGMTVMLIVPLLAFRNISTSWFAKVVVDRK